MIYALIYPISALLLCIKLSVSTDMSLMGYGINKRLAIQFQCKKASSLLNMLSFSGARFLSS